MDMKSKSNTPCDNYLPNFSQQENINKDVYFLNVATSAEGNFNPAKNSSLNLLKPCSNFTHDQV
jgi:hypothetical protein